MKILIIADSNDFTWRGGHGQANVLISCGDTCDQLILQAADAYKCGQIFAVKGNHDSPAPFPKPIVDLHLRTEEYRGIHFGGMNGSWKYKPQGHFPYEQHEVTDHLNSFPRVDLFISHNSPRTIHDREDNVHIGFDGLLEYIRRCKPIMLIHGHQHMDIETVVCGTRVSGVFGHKVIEI
jgi:Icc-related predicted phosphoesterase